MRAMARQLGVGGVLLALVSVLPAGAPALDLTGEGRVVAVDRSKRSITVEHGPIEDVFVAGRTEFPVQADDLLDRVRIDDRIAFTLAAPREGHGELAISDLRVGPRRLREALGAGLPVRGLELAVLGSLLAVIIG